jgi:hypothetical protein
MRSYNVHWVIDLFLLVRIKLSIVEFEMVVTSRNWCLFAYETIPASEAIEKYPLEYTGSHTPTV